MVGGRSTWWPPLISMLDLADECVGVSIRGGSGLQFAKALFFAKAEFQVSAN